MNVKDQLWLGLRVFLKMNGFSSECDKCVYQDDHEGFST